MRIITIILFAAVTNAFAQCPIPGICTYTAVNGTNYTVNAGQVLCISSSTNYTSGTITLNGGTVYVESGSSLGTDIAPSAASTINICGTLSGTRKFNSNATLNYYGISPISIDYSNGGTVNNYSATSISITKINVSGSALTNYASGVNLSISNYNAGLNLTNQSTASLTVTSSPTVTSGSNIVNNGILTWSPTFIINAATIINNGGAVFNATNATANYNGTIINNIGTYNIGGTTFQSNTVVNNNGSLVQASGLFNVANPSTINNFGALTAYNLDMNGGSITMKDQSTLNVTNSITNLSSSISMSPTGCSYVSVGGQENTSSINTNLITSTGGTVNVCGKVPYQTTDADNITAATNTNPIHITVSTNTNGHITNGAQMYITNTTGNTAANGLWTVANWNAVTKTFDLVGSDGTTSGSYSGGGTVNYRQSLGTATYVGYTTCSNPCLPLPVKLMYVNATESNDVVTINWATAMEFNNQYFSVERSSDAIHFETIQIMKGSKNSNSMIGYTAYDKSPLSGLSYYRLKQVDMDGKFTYSSLVSVDTKEASNLIVYPNPSTDVFIIESTSTKSEIQSLTITDFSGAVVKSYDQNTFQNKLIVSDLSKGMYIIHLVSINTISSEKVIIQ